MRLALAAAIVLVATPAYAGPESSTCIASAEQGQRARYDGKLRTARDAFVVCARTTCPAQIHDDCTRWLAEIETSLPSIVPGAQWSDGQDVLAARLTIDGAAVEANGRALPIDPGEHELAVTHPDARAPVTQTFVVREGEKNRSVRISLDRRAVVVPPTPTPTTTRRPVPVASWILGGVALAGAGAAVGLWLSGRSGLDDLRADCGHRCAEDDVDGQRTKLLVGDVASVAGAVALGAATWFFLRRPTVTTTAASPFAVRF